MPDYRNNSVKYWDDVHQNQKRDRNSIRTDNWLERFDDIIMKSKKPILDLGCGGGNDTLWLISKGRKVIACDQSETAVDSIIRNFPEVYEAQCFNMLDGFPFEEDSFDVIIADLCLHYFSKADTLVVAEEIRRILIPGGHMIFRVNSINDVNYGAGQGREIEHHVYETKAGTLKRFFDEEDICSLFRSFEIEYLNEEAMDRYGAEKRLFTGCLKLEL